MRRRFFNNMFDTNLNHLYLSFTAEQDGSSISLISHKTSPDIKYSLNGADWIQWDYNAIILNTGDIVRMKGNNNNGFSLTVSDYNEFSMSGKISASGNIMSLLYEDNFRNKLKIPRAYCFYGLFWECESLTTAPELPATTLTPCCYTHMFEGCTNLTTAPELLATTLATACYNDMFCNCSKLNYIKMLAIDILTSGGLNNWARNVSSTGTFVKNKDATWDTTPGALGGSGVPAGWTVKTE